MHGIERSIDKLGRIILPIEYREKLGIKTDDKIIISLDNGLIILSPYKRMCALCGKEISDSKQMRICDLCIKKIKEE